MNEKIDAILDDYATSAYIYQHKVDNSVSHSSNVMGAAHEKARHALLAAHQAEVERIIGEDEVRPESGPQRNGIMQGLRRARNKLRAEQRHRAGITTSESTGGD